VLLAIMKKITFAKIRDFSEEARKQESLNFELEAMLDNSRL